MLTLKFNDINIVDPDILDIFCLCVCFSSFRIRLWLGKTGYLIWHEFNTRGCKFDQLTSSHWDHLPAELMSYSSKNAEFNTDAQSHQCNQNKHEKLIPWNFITGWFLTTLISGLGRSNLFIQNYFSFGRRNTCFGWLLLMSSFIKRPKKTPAVSLLRISHFVVLNIYPNFTTCATNV